MPFYEATAQILPVLFLALVVEHRLLQPSVADDRPAWLVGGVRIVWYAVGTTFTWAEFSCLYVLATGEPVERSTDNVIILAYIMAIFAFVFPLVNRSMAESERLGRWKGLGFQLMFFAVLVGLGYVLVELLR